MLNHAAASRRLHDAMLGRSNRRVIDCWLAQWRGNELPSWPEFDIQPVQDLSAGMVAFELYPDDRLICVLCGDFIRRFTGMDLTGQDWVSLALPEQRSMRLAGYRNVATGAVGHSLRYGQHASGEVHYMEEILLPFATLPGGIVPVLAHLGWRPAEHASSGEPEFRNARAIPDEFTMVSLKA